MDAGAALAVTTAVVVLALALGVVMRARGGRVRVSEGGTALDLPGLPAAGDDGRRPPTVVQLSSPYCATCPTTRRLIAEVLAGRSDVRRHEVDLAEHPELARRLRVLQTPTLLLLDGRGVETARIGGAPSAAVLSAAIDRLAFGAPAEPRPAARSRT